LVFNGNYSNYRETQRAVYLNVPLMGQWNTHGFSEYIDFYAQAGFKLGFAVDGSYSLTAGKLVNSGDLDILMGHPFTDMPEHNFIEEVGPNYDGSLSFGFNLALSAEAGVKWRLAERLWVYTGLFIDYGLLNIAPSASGTLIDVSTVNLPADLTYNSMLASQPVAGSNFTESVHLLFAGVNVRLAFGNSPKKAKPAILDNADISASKADIQRLEERLRRAEENAAKAEATSKEVKEVTKEMTVQKDAEEKVKEVAEYTSALKTLLEPIKETSADFAVNQTDIASDQIIMLNKKVDIMKRYPNIKVTVEGHTCNLGTHEVNMVVGLRRATSVKQYMVERGISQDRISVASKAETEPLYPNTGEANRNRNRRVEFKITEKE
jgi:outer membrane protein OmpA-like peptidoglycan-associated protein